MYRNENTDFENGTDANSSLINLELQQLPNFKTAEILPQTITLQSWFDLIRTGSGRAREFDMQRERKFVKKHGDNKPVKEYEEFKSTLPIILPHSYCKNNYKNGANVEFITGLFLYDFDCSSKEVANQLKIDLINQYQNIALAIYLTPSAEGVAMLVGTDLSIDFKNNVGRVHFQKIYHHIAHTIGLKRKQESATYYDDNCADIVRNACSSYDPEIFIQNTDDSNFKLLNFNHDDFIHNLLKLENKQEDGDPPVDKVTKSINRGRYIDTLTTVTLKEEPLLTLPQIQRLVDMEMTEEESKVIFLNGNEIFMEGDIEQYKVYSKKKTFYPVFKMGSKKNSKIDDGKRNRTLFAICRNIILNNEATFNKLRLFAIPSLFRYLNNINIHYCSEPISKTEICKIIKSCYNYWLRGTLTSHFKKEKYLAFKKGNILTQFQKQSIGARIGRKMTKENNDLKIEMAFNAFIEKTGMLPTQEQLAKTVECNVSTIKSRWKILMNYYPHLNSSRNN
jgi:hypothetical protein